MTDAAPAERSPGPRRFGELGPTQSTSNVSTRSSTTGPLAQDIARADAPNGRDTPPVPGAFITAPSPAHVHGRPRSARASTFTSTSGSWHTALPDDLPNAHTANAAAETAQGLETPSEQQATGPRLPWISRMLAVFGRGRAGSRRRKALVSLIVASVEGSAQVRSGYRFPIPGSLTRAFIDRHHHRTRRIFRSQGQSDARARERVGCMRAATGSVERHMALPDPIDVLPGRVELADCTILAGGVSRISDHFTGARLTPSGGQRNYKRRRGGSGCQRPATTTTSRTYCASHRKARQVLTSCYRLCSRRWACDKKWSTE